MLWNNLQVAIIVLALVAAAAADSYGYNKPSYGHGYSAPAYKDNYAYVQLFVKILKSN